MIVNTNQTKPGGTRRIAGNSDEPAEYASRRELIGVVAVPGAATLALATPAFPHDHSPQQGRHIDVDGRLLPYDDQIVWATIPTNCGLPSTTIPAARTENGLPVGGQVIGGYLSDRTTLAFAGMIEQEFGGFARPPGF